MSGRSVLTSSVREARLLVFVVHGELVSLSSAKRELVAAPVVPRPLLESGSSAKREALDRWAEFGVEFSGEEPKSDIVGDDG